MVEGKTPIGTEEIGSALEIGRGLATLDDGTTGTTMLLRMLLIGMGKMATGVVVAVVVGAVDPPVPVNKMPEASTVVPRVGVATTAGSEDEIIPPGPKVIAASVEVEVGVVLAAALDSDTVG